MHFRLIGLCFQVNICSLRAKIVPGPFRPIMQRLTLFHYSYSPHCNALHCYVPAFFYWLYSLNIGTIMVLPLPLVQVLPNCQARPPTGSKISKISETLQHKSMHQQICWKDNKGHPYQSDIRLHVYSSGLCSGLFLLEAIFLGSRVL